MNRETRHTGRHRRRGTILVLVVGILALLFIIGATSLLMMRFERQNVSTHATVRNLDAVAAALMNPIIAQLRKDIVGDNNIPYDRGWGSDETSLMEDYADSPGYRSGLGIRNGDLLLSSIEPYYDGTDYRWPFLSWGYDAVLNPGSAPAEGLLRDQRVYITGGPGLDVSGDGLRDGIEADVFAGLSGMFGGNYRTRIRVIPHGGMVLLDPYTHPALLAQVIHPQDATYHNNPALLWTTGGLTPDPLTHESDLRRRYFLPPRLADPAEAPLIVDLLPFTMGYEDPIYDVEHWWPIDDSLVEGDADWWKQRLIAGPSLTDQSYSAANDRYDRRRLLTTLNSDDVLRRRRGEDFIRNRDGDEDDGVLAPFYYVLNPEDATTNPFAYGVVGGGTELAFNGPGLRTQFSLRDVLEHATGRGSYRRAMQLTTYYLAMMQGTYPTHTAPHYEMEQLWTAAQLAVNTIDFADPDPDLRPSYFAWPDTDPLVEVVGVKRQPYLTEAYTRFVYTSAIKGEGENIEIYWDAETVDAVYAIELYNPYDTTIDLSDFAIWVAPALAKGFHADETSATTANITFSPGTTIPAYSYLVVSNMDIETTDPVEIVERLGFLPDPANWHVAPLLEIKQGDDVALMRNTVKNLFTGVSDLKYVMVDLMRPMGVEAIPATWLGANPTTWAYPGTDQDTLDAHPRQPEGADETLVLDSSLQRHKEMPGGPPRHWHFTLARQWLFPLELEVPDGEGTGALEKAFFGAPWQLPTPAELLDDEDRLLQHQHNLMPINPPDGNQQIIVERDFLGLPLLLLFPNPGGIPDPVGIRPTGENPLAPFPVVCPVNPPNGIAFPTTGTLLLVTRYAHTPGGPVTVAATKNPHVPPYEIDPDPDPEAEPPRYRLNAPLDNLQMLKLDNGHLPIFDPTKVYPYMDESVVQDNNLLEYCLDLELEQGRSDFPWGQLVFDYFTALPLEELTALPAGANYDADYAALFPYYPVVSPVESSFGAKVRGRININVAPWWILNGLPMLAEPKDTGDPDELPARELHSLWLDPSGSAVYPPAAEFSDPDRRPAERLMRMLVDDATSPTAAPPFNWTTASHLFAKTMVAHREMRRVYDAAGNVEVDLPHGPSDAPGFVSVGNLCELVTRVGVEVVDPQGLTLSGRPLPGLRDHTYLEIAGNENTRQRPFGYIGYLQLVAPVVRLQDWVTNRNHAFTIYGSISTTTDPAIHLRMQTTVDRSPCLYGGTPTTIVTPPTGYYNALED